jgi:Bacterial protein of unknown function (DUF885)
LRFNKFYTDELHALEVIDFGHLAHEDQVDYLLFRNLLLSQIHQQTIRKQRIDEMAPLLPFAKNVENLLEAKRVMQRPDGEKAAKVLTEIALQIEAARREFDSVPRGSASSKCAKPQIDPVVANRAVNATGQISTALHDWFDQYHGYDPVFTWWVDQPFRDVDKALANYSAFLKEKLIGIAPDDKTTIIGDPIGRNALLAELQDTLIPYTPEELIAIAQTEYDWCMKEMLKASHEMGYGDDWHAAVEKVKTIHVAPGEQPELIRKLVDWEQRAEQLHRQLLKSIDANTRRDLSPPYVPLMPGSKYTFQESMANERPSEQQWSHPKNGSYPEVRAFGVKMAGEENLILAAI